MPPSGIGDRGFLSHIIANAQQCCVSEEGSKNPRLMAVFVPSSAILMLLRPLPAAHLDKKRSPLYPGRFMQVACCQLCCRAVWEPWLQPPSGDGPCQAFLEHLSWKEVAPSPGLNPTVFCVS